MGRYALIVMVGVLLSNFFMIFHDASSDAGPVRSTMTVDDSGGSDHITIQDALDAASVGDLIYVYAGDYSGDLIIEFTFPDPGAFEIVLEVFDERGNQASGSIWIAVEKLNETVEPDDDNETTDPESDDNIIYGMIIAGAVIFIIILVLLILVIFILFKRSDKSSGEELDDPLPDDGIGNGSGIRSYSSDSVYSLEVNRKNNIL